MSSGTYEITSAGAVSVTSSPSVMYSATGAASSSESSPSDMLKKVTDVATSSSV